ncbi:hypothetical protein DXG01_003915 [Tephrocybe rancida]|nr:hypothetical protein DXG01_003915 [Tephrocybe rancida]
MPSSPYERLSDRDAPAEGSRFTDGQTALARPQIYYGEGPFDPPSSDDEDDLETGGLLDKRTAPSSPRLAELGGGFASGSGHTSDDTEDLKKKHWTSIRVLAVLLFIIIALSSLIGVFAARSYKGAVEYRTGTRKITMDHVFNGTFSAERKTVNWVPEGTFCSHLSLTCSDWVPTAGDGVFSIFELGDLKLVDLKTNTTKVLVSSKDIKDENGNTLSWFSWDLSPDMKYILLKTGYRKQWRWSTFGNYYVHDIEEKTTHPIIPPTDPSNTAYATWAPKGQSIAYVTENDLYVLSTPTSSPIRITSSGNASLFHGVPDWVYEEEIFSSDFALWWSPDATKLAFLVFDETAVDEYNFPIYNPTNDNDAVIPYTSDVIMKYPKPGYNNPLVSVRVFDFARHLVDAASTTGVDFPAAENTHELEWPERHPSNDSVVLEVTWVGNSELILKEVNRNADDGNVVLFNLDNTTARSQGKVVRKLGKKGEQRDNGWIDNDQTIRPLPANLTAGGAGAYLDVVPTPDGYNHIALFSPASSGTPQFLTSGKWEVTGGIKGIDVRKAVVYFEAANPSSIERHVYSTALPKDLPFKTAEATALTDATKPSFYSTSFSPGAGYYVLNYQGPTIPWQKIVEVGNSSFEHSLTKNEWLTNVTMEYEAPTVIHSTIVSDGYELNVQELRPPRMDDSGRVKYPVLFRVYGGPGSQMVDLRFARTWHDYLACGLSYIIVTVDGRGTGYKGRHLRNPVKDNLGFYETIDQINAAKIWAAKEYVDRKRVGIWGWSYGGFMASKVVEANAGVHSLSMAVAPVTSWRLYDSIYTERYMNLPQLNPGGYINASISNVTGFHNVDYLLAHGSGDDNVHYANSAHLLDMFTKAQVRNFRFRMFTDRLAQTNCEIFKLRDRTTQGPEWTTSGSINMQRCLMRNASESMSFPVSFNNQNHKMLPATMPQKRERPRGLWKARVMAPRLPATHHYERQPPGLEFESDDDNASSSSSSSSNLLRRSLSLETLSDVEQIYYWDYSRNCSPYPDRGSNWDSLKQKMDVSSTAGPGSSSENPSWTYEDWEDLKELYAQAADQYENGDASEVLLVIRGNSNGKSGLQFSSMSAANERILSQCVELPTAFHVILGTVLFMFGNLIAQDPSQAAPGEPETPVPYWLAALDVFETGESLPSRTSGRGVEAPEDWQMAIIWGRTLVCIAEEFITREAKASKERHGPTGGSPSMAEFFADDPEWPPESPFATIASHRPPITRRMTLSCASPNDLMVFAMDQFSRGIFRMPHNVQQAQPQPLLAELFSRPKELFQIASEVLSVAEKLTVPTERHFWASWADSVFNQMKMEADMDAWRGPINRARGRCWLVVGTARYEDFEAAMEESDASLADSREAQEAREGLLKAVAFFERAKGSASAQELSDPDVQELQNLLAETLLTLGNLAPVKEQQEEYYARAKLEGGRDYLMDEESDSGQDSDGDEIMHDS